LACQPNTWDLKAWVSAMPHVGRVLKIARISDIIVRLTLVKLVGSHLLGSQVDSVGVTIVVLLLLLLLMVLHWTRRKLAIWICHRWVWMLVPVVSFVLTVKLFRGTSSVEGEVRETPANLCHDASASGSVPYSTIALSSRGAWLRGEKMWPH
jgi:hypothetical protein